MQKSSKLQIVSLSSSYTWEFTTTCSRKEAVLAIIVPPPHNPIMELILSFSYLINSGMMNYLGFYYTKQQTDHWL